MTAKRISRASSNLTDPPMALQLRNCWEATDSIHHSVTIVEQEDLVLEWQTAHRTAVNLRRSCCIWSKV